MIKFNVLAYLIIFLPLLSSITVNFFSKRKIIEWIYLGTISAMILLTSMLFPYIQDNYEMQNSITRGIISIGTEYKIDAFEWLFLLLVLISNLISFLYYLSKDYESNENPTMFFVIYLINLFGAVGIVVTDCIFNLFIFIEIYCITLYSLMSNLKSKKLSFLSFRDFINGSIGSILILLGIVFLHSNFGFYKISEYQVENLQIISAQNLASTKLILIILVIGVFSKFFNFLFYFYKAKASAFKDTLMLFSLFFTKAVLGIFILLKIIFVIFGRDIASETFYLSGGLFIVSAICILFFLYKYFQSDTCEKIVIYLLNIIAGFVLMSMSLTNTFGIKASLIFVIEYLLVGLLLLIGASHIYSVTGTSKVSDLKFLRNIKIKELWQFGFLDVSVALFSMFGGWYLIKAALYSGVLFKFASMTTVLVAVFVLLINFVRIMEQIFYSDFKETVVSNKRKEAFAANRNIFYKLSIYSSVIANAIFLIFFYEIKDFLEVIAISLR